jgi:hypothetical protein
MRSQGPRGPHSSGKWGGCYVYDFVHLVDCGLAARFDSIPRIKSVYSHPSKYGSGFSDYAFRAGPRRPHLTASRRRFVDWRVCAWASARKRGGTIFET